MLVHVDHERRTALEVDRDETTVCYLTIDTQEGFKVHRTDIIDFIRRFKPLEDYPAERCAALYASYARDLGATEEAMRYLKKFTSITQEDITMATAKSSTRAAAPAPSKTVDQAKKNEAQALQASLKTGTRSGSLPAHGPSKPAGKPVVKMADTPKVTSKNPPAKKEKPEKEARRTAASEFKRLIMEGKLTDSAIFAQVQKEFGLDDKKRSHVAWYRFDLRRNGEKAPDKLPEAKSAPAKKVATPAPAAKTIVAKQAPAKAPAKAAAPVRAAAKPVAKPVAKAPAKKAAAKPVAKKKA